MDETKREHELYVFWTNELYENLKRGGYKSLIKLITLQCTLHVLPNTFRKGVVSLEFTEMIEQLLFGLYAWNLGD